MTDPTISCPSRVTEIKLTESLAAPVILATREEHEAKIARKDAEVAQREDDLKAQLDAVEQARATIEDQVQEKLAAGRAAVAAEEATDLQSKVTELAELQELLVQRNQKLQKAQKDRAVLLRKQRELDEAKRELNLTIEKRVQDSLVEVRQNDRPNRCKRRRSVKFSLRHDARGRSRACRPHFSTPISQRTSHT